MGNGKQSNATRLASIETMLSERLREGLKFENEVRDEFKEVKTQLVKLVANGGKAMTIEDMKNALVAHAESCPARANPGNALKEGWSTLKEGWKTLAAVVTLATGLSVILGKLLDRLGG